MWKDGNILVYDTWFWNENLKQKSFWYKFSSLVQWWLFSSPLFGSAGYVELISCSSVRLNKVDLGIFECRISETCEDFSKVDEKLCMHNIFTKIKSNTNFAADAIYC